MNITVNFRKIFRYLIQFSILNQTIIRFLKLSADRTVSFLSVQYESYRTESRNHTGS